MDLNYHDAKPQDQDIGGGGSPGLQKKLDEDEHFPVKPVSEQCALTLRAMCEGMESSTKS